MVGRDTDKAEGGERTSEKEEEVEGEEGVDVEEERRARMRRKRCYARKERHMRVQSGWVGGRRRRV